MDQDNRVHVMITSPTSNFEAASFVASVGTDTILDDLALLAQSLRPGTILCATPFIGGDTGFRYEVPARRRGKR